MNKEKLEAKSPVELINGARCLHLLSSTSSDGWASRFRFGGLPELYVYREPVEEEEEPSSPPIEAEVHLLKPAKWEGISGVHLTFEVTGTALAEDAPDLPPAWT